MINPLSLIPSWGTWAAIGVLTAAVGVQQVRVANLKTDLAEQVSARATETTARAKMALDHADAIGKLQYQHAADQQQKEDDYAKKIRSLETAGAAQRADAQRMRDKLTAFTSGDRRPGETDAAACQRARDRLPLVGALLEEGIGLETESRAIIERRDAEVGRLQEQITIDRTACSALVR